MNFNTLIIILLSYFTGAIPFAWIIVKIFETKDIRTEGTGNIGAMNSYDITRKKWLGIVVFLLDFGKGILAVYLAKKIVGNDLMLAGLATIFVVLGHNYSIFMKFKGGRGLAAAAGASILINPLIIILWVVMWLTGYFGIKRHVHIGNIVASMGTAILIFSTPDHMIFMTQSFYFNDLLMFKILTSVIMFVILLKHIGPVMDLIKKKEVL